MWVEADGDNAVRVWRALADFGAPLATLDVTVEDFASASGIVQLGVPPRRIDLLTEIDGVAFASAWRNRFTSTIDGHPVPFLSYDDLLRNKRAAARPKDLLDVELLERNRLRPSERE